MWMDIQYVVRTVRTYIPYGNGYGMDDVYCSAYVIQYPGTAVRGNGTFSFFLNDNTAHMSRVMYRTVCDYVYCTDDNAPCCCYVLLPRYLVKNPDTSSSAPLTSRATSSCVASPRITQPCTMSG